MKKFFKYLPEAYFIVLCSWWASLGFLNNPFIIYYPALIIVFILTLQLYFRNNKMGFAISIILGLLSCYFILALISDIADIVSITERTVKFIIVGTVLVVTNLAMSALMIKKYRLKKPLPAEMI